jgi:hypothetical protein
MRWMSSRSSSVDLAACGIRRVCLLVQVVLHDSQEWGEGFRDGAGG